MNMFLTLYNDIIYRPLLNLLVFFYNIIPGHDIGIVIILVTIVIRLVLAPSFHKSLKSQKAMNDLQPKLNEMREKHKDDKEAQAKAMMELYKEHKINPLSSCLPLLLQMPILIGLYQVFRIALGGHQLSGLYSFIHAPMAVSAKFLGLVDLSRIPWTNGSFYIPGAIFAVMAALAQFWQSKMMIPKTPGTDATTKAMQMQTTYILPLITIYFGVKLFPVGLSLYWIVTTLFAVAQQYYIKRQTNEHKLETN